MTPYLLFASLAWGDTIHINDTKIPDELVCDVLFRYQFPCYVEDTGWGPFGTITQCKIFYGAWPYTCRIYFDAYPTPPKGSILEGWQLHEVPNYMGDGVVQYYSLGVRGSPYRYPYSNVESTKHEE